MPHAVRVVGVQTEVSGGGRSKGGTGWNEECSRNRQRQGQPDGAAGRSIAGGRRVADLAGAGLVSRLYGDQAARTANPRLAVVVAVDRGVPDSATRGSLCSPRGRVDAR